MHELWSDCNCKSHCSSCIARFNENVAMFALLCVVLPFRFCIFADRVISSFFCSVEVVVPVVLCRVIVTAMSTDKLSQQD